MGGALVVGLGVSGEAVARRMAERGDRVVVLEDSPGEASRARARRLGRVEVVEAPSAEQVAELVAGADVVVPSPGVPVGHPALALAFAAGTPVLSELELASRWASAPLVAVTGTNGKTTVTTLVTDMLVASGKDAVAAGNIGFALSDAVAGPAQVIVVEASSFQLHLTERFRPAVAVWLNLADDHLDWHPDRRAYAAAKARVWANQEDGDVAVANADDPTVAEAAARAPARVTTFGLGPRPADWHADDEALYGPDGVRVAVLDEMEWARTPAAVSNALAAAAAASAAGAGLDGVRAALGRFRGLPHRVTPVGEAGGVVWYDDSKATNPHAVLAALEGLGHVVLVAGGRNKGVDLSVLSAGDDRVRAVVAIGEAAPDVEAAFAGRRPVTVASSMDEAVAHASRLARPGDAVLLSPGCASYDWYGSYAERGDDFARAVRELLGERDGRQG